MDHLWLAIFWILYFLLHSVMALLSIKKYFYSIGLKPQTYRLIYVAIASLTLFAIMAYSSMLKSSFVLNPGILLKVLGLIVSGWGIIIVKVAFKSYDTRAFLGLGNLKPEDEFKTDGLLKMVRHPLYSGSILLVIGYFLFSPKLSVLISTIMMIIYIVVGIRFEENKLVKTFGKKYTEYKKSTPMLIPNIRKKA